MWKLRYVHENYTDPLAICTVWWWSVVVVVVLCGSGGYIIIRLHLHTWWFHPLQLAPVMFSFTPTGADTKLMLGQLALCGGVFLGGGGRCIRVCGGGGCCYGVLVLGKCTSVSQRKY